MSDVFCPANPSVTTTSSATKDSISENALHINLQSLKKYNGNPLSMLTAMQMEIMQMIREICGLLCSVNIKDRPDLSQLKHLHYELLNSYHSYSVEEKNFHSPKENLDILNEKNIVPRRTSLQGVKSTNSISPRSILNMVANKISPKESSNKVLPQKADSKPRSITHALVLDLTLASSNLGAENDMSNSPPLLLRNISRTNTVGNSSEAEVNFYKEVENLAQEAHKLNLKESEKYLKKAMVCENTTLRPKKT
jgi:hypothetical protein